MYLEEIFEGKKLLLDFSDRDLEQKVLNFFAEKEIHVTQGKKEECDYIITDRKDCKASNCVKVGRLFNPSFLKELHNVSSIGIYKGIYFVFPTPVFYSSYDRMFFYVFILFLLVLPTVFVPIPPDDLLRHFIAYKYDFYYSKVFINSSIPSWDFYLLFDFIVGGIHKFCSLIPVDYFRENLPFILVFYLFSFLTLFAVKVNVGSVPRTYLLFFFSLFMGATGGRIFLERPSVLATLLFFISLGYLIQKKERLGLIFSFLISLFYYLFFIYLIPLIFFNRKVFIPLLFGFFYWSVIAYLDGGEYFLDVYRYILSLKGDLTASENKSLIFSLNNPLIVIVLVLLFLNLKRSKKRYVYPSFWFLLSNQIRYVENIGPLLLFSVQDAVIEFLDKFLRKNLLAIFVISISVFVSYYKGVYSETVRLSREVCSIMEGGKVKTTLGLNFSVVYFCESIKVNPPMEIRWSKDLELDKNLVRGKINCSDERLYNYDYLLENSLEGKFECLKFLYRGKGFVLWKIEKQ